MTAPLVHLKRAFGWNLARVVPSERETAALEAAGVKDPAVQRYAAWRRSLLLVAFVPVLLAGLFAVWDLVEDGLEEKTLLGALLDVGILVAAVALPIACLVGIRGWTRPGAGARPLALVWLFAFLLPFVYALVPNELIYDFEEEPSEAVADSRGLTGLTGDTQDDLEVTAKVESLEYATRDLVLSAAAFLLLLPGLISILPGTMNGCLRVKSALPAASLPGWLLVWVAPVFLLFWLAMLVLVGPATQSNLLLLGVLLWAGGPLAYALQAGVFTRPQIGAEEEARIGRAKKVAGLVSLAGIALIVTYVLTAEVVELSLVGTDPELALDAKLDELGGDDAPSLQEMVEAYKESDALIYGFDPSFLYLLLDIVAKLLLTTAVFAHLVLRATLASWRNDQALRARPEATAFDESASAAIAAIARPPG